jgi:hypothetical protein
MSQEAEAEELELFIQHQMEQERQDQYDLKLLQEQQEEECPGHEYEFLEPLPNHLEEPDVYRELWHCLVCGKTRVLTAHVGVRD